VSEKSEWNWTTLGKVLPIRYGKARTEKAGVVREETAVYGSSGVIDKFNRALTNGPALIIGRKGTVGATHYSSEPCWPIDTVYFAEESEDKDLRFFKYLLDHLQLGRMDRSTAVPGLSRDDYNAKEVAIPHIDEQRRIVAEIEKQFTRLETGVVALQSIRAKLKRYRAAILKAACEGSLVQTEAELARKENRSYESAEILLQRISKERCEKWNGKGKYKEPVAPDKAEVASLPEGWAWATVDQLAAPEPNSITDGPFGSNLKTEHYTPAGPRVIRLQNIGDGIFVDEEAHISQEHFENLQKHRVFGGDLVIAALGENPPRSCQVPESLGLAIVKADCIRFKPHADVAPKYANFALNSDPVRKRTKNIVHGVGRPRLNLSEIKSIVVPLPPLAEQARIVAEVERRLSVVEELEAVLSANLQRAKGLRQAVLQRAFEGELTAAADDR
jgi:type I restriction enzyme, S subunit